MHRLLSQIFQQTVDPRVIEAPQPTLITNAASSSSSAQSSESSPLLSAFFCAGAHAFTYESSSVVGEPPQVESASDVLSTIGSALSLGASSLQPSDPQHSQPSPEIHILDGDLSELSELSEDDDDFTDTPGKSTERPKSSTRDESSSTQSTDFRESSGDLTQSEKTSSSSSANSQESGNADVVSRPITRALARQLGAAGTAPEAMGIEREELSEDALSDSGKHETPPQQVRSPSREIVSSSAQSGKILSSTQTNF